MITIKDIPLIAQGYINAFRAELGIADKGTEEEYKRRYEICLNCPIISDDKLSCDKKKTGCGCKLAKRLRSNKGCPKGRW